MSMSPYLVIVTFYTILLAFFAVTFLESGIDKAINSSGNLSFFQSHFKGSLFESIVKPLFWVLTVEELLLGIGFTISAVGIWLHWYSFVFSVCIYGMFVFLQLFTGQRIAKDYAGASGLLPYVILLAMTTILLNFI